MGLPKFDFRFDATLLPKNGIYILFEKGETGHRAQRIVRVGTHAGSNQLQSTLRQHFVAEEKDKSILRKNIGRALLNRDHDAYLTLWDVALTTPMQRSVFAEKVGMEKMNAVEKHVTGYMHDSFSFVVFGVEHKAERLLWESKIISTVAQCHDCRASADWLGSHSTQEKIRESGLWQLNELYQEPLSDIDLEELALIVIPG